MSTMPHDPAVDPLTTEQRARASALRLAAEILARPVRPSPFAPGPRPARNEVDVTDVHSLAVFILDGGDPWLDHAPTHVVEATGRPLYTEEEAHAMVKAALEDVRERFEERHVETGRVLCSKTLGEVLDEVRP
jgi:hypothetical protein